MFRITPTVKNSSFDFFLFGQGLKSDSIFGQIQNIFMVKNWNFKGSIFKCMGKSGVIKSQMMYFVLMHISFIITFEA